LWFQSMDDIRRLSYYMYDDFFWNTRPPKITMNYSFHCIALHAKRARRFFIEHFGESYISIMDNVKIHRRGSQQKYNPYEADSCFGKFYEGRWWSTANTRWRIHQWPKEACVD
jgi:hypothetical protein